ncbi:MAG: HEAT repeat domain-containing protein [Bythopirellula sp.]
MSTPLNICRCGSTRWCFRALAGMLLWSGLGCWATADIVQLKSGGELSGVIVERANNEYLVKRHNGALVKLSRRQVKQVVPQDKADLRYAQRSRSLPDTVAAHRELADWCKENRLTKLANHHLQRIIELDPTDEAARTSLGYQQHRGRWMTRDDIMAARGLQKYKDGKYRTPQDIALREHTKQRESLEVQWFRDMRTWVAWLDGRKAAEGAALIREINDPLAAFGLVKLLKGESNQRVRDLLTATLAPLNHPLAVTTLVDLSLDEPDPEVRLQCTDFLLQYHQPIRLTPYVRSLQDPNNEIVNRAAEALLRIGDPEAISPLIDALVTTHKFNNPNAPVGNIGASFSPNGAPSGGGVGGGGLSMGGNKSKVIQQNIKNLKVRQALVELSRGQDYEFDEKLWRMWFVNEQIEDYVDTRRDQ